ncbi:MAG: tetratricopeptide repeat protein [Prevotella sp.]|nr:tetratricopeptide repeat protein [Prevotella sp.]
MGFWKALFGGEEQSPEQEKEQQEQKRFELLKYDGVRALKTGRLDIAESCLREALTMREDLEVRDYLWQLLVRLDRTDEALEHLKAMSEAQPDNVELKLQMATVAYMKEDYALMEQVLEPLTSVSAESLQGDSHLTTAQAFYLMAQARWRQQDRQGATEWLTKAIAVYPEMGEAYLLRGQTLLEMGDSDGAASDELWLEDNYGETEEVLLLKSAIEQVKGQQEQAIATLGRVLELNPFSQPALQRRAALRRTVGDEAGAEEDLQAARELNPQQDTEDIESKVQDAYKNVNPLGI